MGEEVGEIHYLGVRILGNTHYPSDRRVMVYRLGLNLDSFELLLDNTELDGYTILKVMPDTNDCYKYPLVRVKEVLNIDIDSPANRYYSCELITRNKDEFISVLDLIHYPLVKDYPLLRGYAKGVLLYDNLIKQRVEQAQYEKDRSI